MTTDPIRFLDDPSIAAELREVMLGQDTPDALPASQRDLVQRRIAASVLALPVSLKLGGMVSQGTAGTGAVSGGAVSGGAVSGGAVSGGAVSGGAVSGGVAAASVSAAPAAVGGALASGTLASGGVTLAGAKGALASIASVVTMTKGAAVLGVALATGAGATYVASEAAPTRDLAVQVEPSSQTAPARSVGDSARRSASASGRTEGNVRVGAPDVEAPASPVSRQVDAPAPTAGTTRASGVMSLADLEDIRDGAAHEAVPAVRSPSRLAVDEKPGADEQPAAVNARPTSPSSEQLQEEVALLRRARELLRSDRTLAVKVLDRYDTKFPQGAMRAEYDVLRRRAERELER